MGIERNELYLVSDHSMLDTKYIDTLLVLPHLILTTLQD